MAKVGLSLRLLHDEYGERFRRGGKVAMGYTKFCGDCAAWTTANSLTKRIEHKAGQSCEVNWLGPTPGKGLVSPVTGEVSKIYLFVGVLPFSQKAYLEPTLDIKERTWLRCHVHMHEHWGGVPECTLYDNLKTGVVKHPREGEVVLSVPPRGGSQDLRRARLLEDAGPRRIDAGEAILPGCGRGWKVRARQGVHQLLRNRETLLLWSIISIASSPSLNVDVW